MAPKKHGKATPKAAVKKAAAKKAMAKKVAAKSLPKRPNKPAVTAVKLEPGAAQESEEASGSFWVWTAPLLLQTWRTLQHAHAETFLSGGDSAALTQVRREP